MFFSMVLGIESGPGVLFLVRCFTQRSYVFLSKYVVIGVEGSPRLSNTNPLISFHGYCRTLHVQSGGCEGW